MTAANPIRTALQDALEPVGFHRKGDSWFATSEDVVQVVNLQKSQYGQQYYVNVGLWLSALGPPAKPQPKEEQCHIRLRLTAISPDENELRRLLDLETAISEGTRKSELAALVASQLVPFMGSAKTVSGVRTLLERGALKKAMVHAAAKKLLSSSALA